jgi:UDP-N-acetylglucosamine/UDP-N-acetylgalactosamine diphosphorylase
MGDIEFEEIRAKWVEAGQGHVFKFVHKLNPEEKDKLRQQLKGIDVKLVNDIYQEQITKGFSFNILQKSGEGREEKGVEIKPMKDITKLTDVTPEDKKRWLSLGYQEIAEGHVALLLMAGGQGTRLGSDLPKGMYVVGTPSGKSLYQIQAERILRLQFLASEFAGKKSVSLPWYIMTSFATDAPTKEFFEKNNFFGLEKDQVIFFKQEEFPCITPEGKIILENKCKIATAPNGNGGLYAALVQTGTLDDMERRGVTWISSYCVDNILVRVADPLFVGFCKEKKADCAAKVVAKAYPEEPVGVLCLKDDKHSVIEYSEIDPQRRQARDPDTKELLYNWSHIVLNDFSLDFIKYITRTALHTLPYHIAKKKIPCVNERGETEMPSVNNGWKMELFVFDVFEFSKNMVALEVLRSEEFSPLKNDESAASDNPRTCRQHLSNLHIRFIEAAGGKVIRDKDTTDLCEISPLVTFRGEGIEDLVKGKTFTLPLQLDRTM